MARPWHLLSTLRPLDCSQRTQDSLLVAGQALPDGICTRRVPTKSFRDDSCVTSPLPKLSWRRLRPLCFLPHVEIDPEVLKLFNDVEFAPEE